jgi:maleate isomerase
MEPDFYQMVPKGVSVHITRMKLEKITTEDLMDMAQHAITGSELLASADVDIIIYGCTSGSLVGGVEWEKNLVERIQKKSGVRTISTSYAVIRALDYFEGKKIGVATPYPEESNMLVKFFLESYGFKVSSIMGLGLTDNLEIGRVKTDTIIDLVRRVSKTVDVVFISCTNLPVIHLIERIELEEGIPVVTSNQASFWAAFPDFSPPRINGFGKLLKRNN